MKTATIYTPDRLHRWERPRDYAGANWPEYFSAGVGRSRDSDCLEESNFFAVLRRLGGESETVIVVRESHWAVGFVEWIAIHESDAKALATADELRKRLDDYPILDEEDFSEREYSLCAAFWESAAPSDRIQKLRADGCVTGFRELRAAANGDWGAASNLLRNPSDLIY